MTTAPHGEHEASFALIHQILSEGSRAAQAMSSSRRHVPEKAIVLHRGTVPSVRNLHRRRRTHVFHLGNKGFILLDARTGQPYERCWTGSVPYCVPIDLERVERHKLQKLLRRIQKRIQECQ